MAIAYSGYKLDNLRKWLRGCKCQKEGVKLSFKKGDAEASHHKYYNKIVALIDTDQVAIQG